MKIFAHLNKFKLEIADKIHCIVLNCSFSSNKKRISIECKIYFSVFEIASSYNLVIHLSSPQGYSTVLRSLTSGTATFTLELTNYHPMSLHEQNALLNKKTGLA
uniref:Elongation factor EFG domain-containing protein n=1 Tax=Micrurus lemniscatus lemniscatus TaxID=129467 RepID=A0A2D4HR51_MICLE